MLPAQVFVRFPHMPPESAVRLGKLAARLVTEQLPREMELKFERVMQPFLLLHVNRCGGWQQAPGLPGRESCRQCRPSLNVWNIGTS